ncbi:MAG: insulinase family protein [Opitutaceae bacterium]
MSARFFPWLLLVATFGLACAPHSARGSDAASGGSGPLQPDPAVLLGSLPNGLRYAFRPQPVPPGRVSLCLYVQVGSRHETDDQLGYAHFVEHLAFAGTRDFPGDAAIRTLQRYGLAFGSEINAATGRNYTTYEIRNLPADDPAALATAIKVLRNFADGLLFEADTVERERGVILSERNVRAGRIAYWWARELEFLAPHLDQLSDNEFGAVFNGTPMGRPQIGTPRSLKRATPETLRAFHQTWYRPERMVVTAAGELDPHRLAGLVHGTFGTMPIPLSPAPAEPAIEVPTRRGARVTAFTESESPTEIVALLAAAPRAESGGTASGAQAAEALAIPLLERRLARALGVPARIESVFSHEVPGWVIPVLRLRVAPAHWPMAALALTTEVERARQRGFAGDEVAAAAAVVRRRARWAERDAPNRTGVEVAAALAHAFGGDRMFASAAEERRWTEAALDAVTPEDCRAAVARLWPGETTQLVLTGPVDRYAEEVGNVQNAMGELRRVQLPAFVPQAEATAELPANFGSPGQVVREEHDAPLDCWLVEFDNGVRLNFKPTPFERGQARLRICFGHGLMGTDPGREGLAFGVAALVHGGTTDIPGDKENELRERSGLTVGFGFGADVLGLWANGPAGEIDTALRLFAAHIGHPRFDPRGEPGTRAFIEERLTSFDRTSAGVAEDRLREHLFGGHHAITRPRRSDTERIGYADLRRWIEPQLQDSPIEITIVGDLDLEEAKAAVARTFGALPLRSTVDQMADRRAYEPGPTPRRIDVRFTGRQAVGTVALAWRLPDVVGQDDDCRMLLLTNVLEDRIRVRLRREMGKTYTPQVGLQAERALAPAMLYVRCRIETAPKQLDRVAEAAKQVVAELVRDGVTAEELERARLPLVREAEDNAVSNSWWLFVLGEAQSKPQFLAGQSERVRIFQSATQAELNGWARLLFSPERLCEVRAIPE